MDIYRIGADTDNQAVDQRGNRTIENYKVAGGVLVAVFIAYFVSGFRRRNNPTRL